MRTNGKETDIMNPQEVLPFIMECLCRHRKRHDFHKFLIRECGMTEEDYKAALKDKSLLRAPAMIAAEKATELIRTGYESGAGLDLPLAKIQRRKDKSSFKVRDIACECPMHQLLDYIAVYAAMPIFKRRLSPCQCSSMKNRGPCYGAAKISKWLRKDNAAAEYAERHGRSYNRQCRYYVKIDIEKCYPSMRAEHFLRHFRRDCNNPVLVWLWWALFQLHRVNGYEGFLIGALPSQWAAQYVISFIYRYAMDLHYTRRGRRRKMASHGLTFMDDLLLTGANRSKLARAVRLVEQYVAEEFGLSIKADWQIMEIEASPVDMMGYLIHADGAVTVRPRVFVRTRRMALRIARAGEAEPARAKRVIAYKGYFFQRRGPLAETLRARRPGRKYRLRPVFALAARTVSDNVRRAVQAA